MDRLNWNRESLEMRWSFEHKLSNLNHLSILGVMMLKARCRAREVKAV